MMRPVKCGIDVVMEKPEVFQNLRLGLITNYTGVNQNLKSTIDILHQYGHLTCLFAPEHGVRGNVQAGDHVEDYVDEKTGVQVYSLYGKNRKPNAEMVKDIDAFVFDIQDVGVRYYTYLYTMAYAMEAAKEFNKKIFVLDRPNPLGGEIIEGNVLEEVYSSFVGLYPIPVRYGLTIGELAYLFNKEFHIDCDLEVIPLEGWKREMNFEDTGLSFIAPSPNIPTMNTAFLYTGTCLFEGTNVSEGRGTTQPFEVIGAPWIRGEELAEQLNQRKMEGILFRPHYFTPTFSKHKGELCQGIQIHIQDRHRVQPFKVGVSIVQAIASTYKEFEILPSPKGRGRCFFDLLAGTDQLQKAIKENSVEQYLKQCEEQRKEFNKIREKYLMYSN